MVDRKVRGDRGVGAGEEDGVVSDLTLISSRRAIKVTSSHQQQPGEHEYVSRNLSVPYPCTHHTSSLGCSHVAFLSHAYLKVRR